VVTAVPCWVVALQSKPIHHVSKVWKGIALDFGFTNAARAMANLTLVFRLPSNPTASRPPIAARPKTLSACPIRPVKKPPTVLNQATNLSIANWLRERWGTRLLAKLSNRVVCLHEICVRLIRMFSILNFSIIKVSRKISPFSFLLRWPSVGIIKNGEPPSTNADELLRNQGPLVPCYHFRSN
jgi:hypothetical protein